MPPRDLIDGIDAIRSIAATYGFGTVSSLAGRLESAIGRDGGVSLLPCYLDALTDAVKLEPMRLAAQEALLA